MEVTFTDPDKMNLMGYFLRDLLRTNLKSNPEIFENFTGSILFDAGGMTATLIFKKDFIEICAGADGKTNSKIMGDLNTLLDVALGANYVKFLLTGKIKVKGNLLLLLKIMKLLRVKI